ncbi:PREDICTED: cytochrome c oxidase assembly protein COX15 homolog [Amphimedon queenslandica]|uniref:Cytochrome c oxidase assembly protein COX15 homolog n=1 Tax=Amphimedon queenslandica TaxID=400682 RepID=A0A1X7UQ65_AMPQE|nr:PREDICTED: cytochrome c oxidase assembly protein COX15 homolog [Amphimedon queenslandica]|eukprot:XP_003387082.1 PREDICTED: cytochrome c oxidase assembly protein COX15 homolog [Amphimedon queenslandica]
MSNSMVVVLLRFPVGKMLSSIRHTGTRGLFKTSQSPGLTSSSLRQCLTRSFASDTLSNGTRELKRTDRIVGYWLGGCCVMVIGSVIIGGLTRLTESGLSMTRWHIIKGMKPPRGEKEWNEEFERYKQFPEYEYVHKDITLADFKRIFYMEYIHRMWGRAIGLTFALPAGFFLLKKWVPKHVKPRLGFYAGVILFQGLLGWYMVKSGLESKPKSPGDVPRVSQYRLAAHLGTAIFLYSSMLYTTLGLLLPIQKQNGTPAQLGRLRGLVHGAVAMTFFTALSGAFVAGLDAGLVYNSFPKMAGQWIPDDILALSPKIKNFFENPTTVQFDHRILGTSTLLFVVGTWAMARGVGLSPRARLAVNCMAGMAFIQVGLGISTLLYYVPTSLAAAHQSGSVTLLSLAIWLMHELRKKAPKL